MHNELTALLDQIVDANLTYLLFTINIGNYASVIHVVSLSAAGSGISVIGL